MNYKISKPFAMQSPSHPTLARLSALPVTALLALTVSACAAGPGEPKTLQSASPVTHNCKPQETVGFSCELLDHRLLSLCVSPGFVAFKGLPNDNPGYAYVAVSTPDGKLQHAYPANPSEYKKYMSTGVTQSAWPYVDVASEKGVFFYANGDMETPVSLMPQNLPAGWQVQTPPTRGDSYCKRRMHRENFDSVLLQLPRAVK